MMHVAELTMMNGIPSVSKDNGAFPSQGRGVVAKAMQDVTVEALSPRRVRVRKNARWVAPLTNGTV